MVRVEHSGNGNGQARIDSRNIQKVKFTGFSNFMDLAKH